MQKPITIVKNKPYMDISDSKTLCNKPQNFGNFLSYHQLFVPSP